MSKKLAVPHKASWLVLFGGAIFALGAAFVLSVEELHLIQNPNALLSCSFNLVLNCASVMQTAQASVFFSVPNMFIGLMAFPVIITVAAAALWGGASYRRGFILAMNGGLLLGTIFAYWLFFQSVYVIEVLCPWCLVVTTTCTLMLAASTHVTLKDNLLGLPKKTNTVVQKFLKQGYHQMLVVGWIVVMAVLVYLKFGSDLFV